MISGLAGNRVEAAGEATVYMNDTNEAVVSLRLDFKNLEPGTYEVDTHITNNCASDDGSSAGRLFMSMLGVKSFGRLTVESSGDPEFSGNVTWDIDELLDERAIIVHASTSSSTLHSHSCGDAGFSCVGCGPLRLHE